MSKDFSSRIPPHSIEAEVAALGSMMLSEQAIYEIEGIIKPEMFYQPAHKMVYEAILGSARSGKEADLVAVKDWLLSRSLLKTVGGTEYLIQICEAVPTSSNAVYYADIIYDKWVMRTLETRTEAFRGQIGDPETTAQQKVALGALIIEGLIDARTSEANMADEVFALTESVQPGGVSGIRPIDQHSQAGGYYPGEPNYIAGEQGTGKTNLLVQAAIEGCRRGENVVFASYELSSQKIARRVMRQLTGFSSLDRARLANCETEWDMALKAVSGWSMKVWDARDGDRSIESFTARLKAANVKKKIDRVVVDYAQLFDSRDCPVSKNGKTQAMERIETGFRTINSVLGNVLIIGSQLSSHEGKMYTANSQEFEKGASYVLYLLREGEKEYKLYCKKNRDGRTAWEERLVFDVRTLTFNVPYSESNVFDGEKARK